jgi:hypothetical protein
MLVKADLLSRSNPTRDPLVMVKDHVRAIIGTSRRKHTKSGIELNALECEVANVTLWLRTAGFPPGTPELDHQVNECIDSVRRVFDVGFLRIRTALLCQLERALSVNEFIMESIDDVRDTLTNILYPFRTNLIEGGCSDS